MRDPFEAVSLGELCGRWASRTARSVPVLAEVDMGAG